MPNKNNVLVVSEDPGMRRDLVTVLEFLGEGPVHAGNWQLPGPLPDSPEQMDSFSVAVIVGTDQAAEASLRELATSAPGLPVLLIGGPDVTDLPRDLAIRVIARLEWPLNYAKFVDSLHRAQVYRAQFDLSGGRGQHRGVQLFRSLVGTSRRIQQVRQLMEQVAEQDVSVLISGESGTGKEVVARNLHYHSARRDKPFVPVNCGAIPPELLEGELFGYEKGAFAGAITERSGRCELADGGTLFLDDVSELPLPTQIRVLRLMQEGSFERMGSNRSRPTNVRIIAAADRSLEQLIEAGKFREDLYYRLNVFPIEMPALRDRVEDVPLLINELISRLEQEKRGSLRLNSAAIMSLCRHDWPGNVRELANLVERLAIMYPYGVIGVQELPRKFRYLDEHDEHRGAQDQGLASAVPGLAGLDAPVLLPVNGIDLKDYLANLEKQLIEQALNETGGVVARAAEKLRIRRTTLVEKVRKYGLREETPSS